MLNEVENNFVRNCNKSIDWIVKDFTFVNSVDFHVWRFNDYFRCVILVQSSKYKVQRFLIDWQGTFRNNSFIWKQATIRLSVYM